MARTSRKQRSSSSYGQPGFKISAGLRRKISKYIYILLSALIALMVSYCERIVAPITWPDEGEPTVLYSTQLGDDLRALYLEAIESAKESIFVCVYSLSDKRIAAALKRQHERGITVTVVCDREASPFARNLLGPDIHLVLRHDQGLMHTKITLIDGERVILGTANMTQDSLTVQRNLVSVMHSKALASYLYNALSIQLGVREGIMPERQATFSIGNQPVEMWLLPHNDKAIKRLIELIDSAQKTFHVAMFTFTRYDLANALSRAQRRGVTVHITLDKHQTAGANSNMALFLEKRRVPVYVNRSSPLFHYKVLGIDDTTLVCGSANWTKAAFTQNDDCFIVLNKLNETQQKRLQALWQAIDADNESVLAPIEEQAA
jgi:cardiolipin synthase